MEESGIVVRKVMAIKVEGTNVGRIAWERNTDGKDDL
jgi:hypothetical protein